MRHAASLRARGSNPAAEAAVLRTAAPPWGLRASDRDGCLGRRCCSRTGRLPWSPAAYPRVGPGRMAVSGRTIRRRVPHRTAKGAAVELSVPPCAGLVTVSPVSTGCPAQVQRYFVRIEGLEPPPAVPSRTAAPPVELDPHDSVVVWKDESRPLRVLPGGRLLWSIHTNVVTPGAARSRRGCSACHSGHRRTTPSPRTASTRVRRANARCS